MMPRRPRSRPLDQRGVSLIELLVTVVVLAVLFLIIDLVFINTHRSARKVELTADASQNARVVVGHGKEGQQSRTVRMPRHQA